MAKDFIVAIELGSSKITGMAGKKNTDGSISVLAVVKEDSSSCIRKGVVYNIDKTAQCLANIVSKLKTQLKSEISQVYVGVGGQSVRSVRNVLTKELSSESIVSQDMVFELMDANRNMAYPDYEILDAVTQEYKVGPQYQLDPVGIQASHVEGNFLNILGRKSFYRNLNKCFDNAGIAIAERYLAPIAMADAVLTEAEKRSGCLLVDMGADTTTVLVYNRDILRHIAVIPIGGANVTKDLETLQMDEAEAERMKLKYASAFTDNADIDNTLSYPVDPERSIDSRVFIDAVEARVKEIVENVWFQVPNDYADKLLGGIILTGGASNMPNIEEVFRQTTHIDKIRMAKFVNFSVSAANSKTALPHDATLTTVLGLLAKGDMNCAGGDLADDLFGSTTGAEGTATRVVAASVADNQKQRKEEEERLRKEEEERKARQEEEERERLEREERKRNSPLNRFGNSVRHFFRTLTAPEEDNLNN